MGLARGRGWLGMGNSSMSWEDPSKHSLHRDSGHSRGQLAHAPALHKLDGLLHLHLVVEGDELGLLGALAGYQTLLHVLLIEPVEPDRKRRRWMEPASAGEERPRPGEILTCPSPPTCPPGLPPTCPSSGGGRSGHRCPRCLSEGGPGTEMGPGLGQASLMGSFPTKTSE